MEHLVETQFVKPEVVDSFLTKGELEMMGMLIGDQAAHVLFPQRVPIDCQYCETKSNLLPKKGQEVPRSYRSRLGPAIMEISWRSICA